MKILFRDDDINAYTDAFEFKKLHEQFIAKKQVHTVAVLMKDLWENHALFYSLITAPYLEIGLHGWKHVDYSKLEYDDCLADLKKSLDYWQENATRMLQVQELPENKKIKIFFAPWNREAPPIRYACRDVGLKFCNVKGGKWEDYYIKSFHFWSASIKGEKII